MAEVNLGTYIASATPDFFHELTRFRATNATSCKTGEDILGALFNACNPLPDGGTAGNCIRTWVHAQHGWDPTDPFGSEVDGGFGGGLNTDGSVGDGLGFYGLHPSVPSLINRAGNGRSLVDLQGYIDGGSVQFCSNCRIYIYGCSISEIGNFASDLSVITGAMVFASRGLCSTAHANGDPGTADDNWRSEGNWDVYQGGVLSSPGEKYISPTTGW